MKLLERLTANVPLTRPQRLIFARCLFVAGMFIALWMVWSQRVYAWSAAWPGGVALRKFGLFHYLTITSETAGPWGNPVMQKTVGLHWDWHLGGIVLNALVSIVLGVALCFACFRIVARDRLIGRCDECGYDLTGLWSAKCPECGAAVSATKDA